MSTNETNTSVGYSLPYPVKFTILLSLQIFSILISLVIFISILLNRQNRVETRNHSLLFLLTISFIQTVTDLPIPINFFRLNGIVQPATAGFCTWWIWYELSLNTINVWLMAWISIERHLLIFHSNFIQNIAVWKRRGLHVGPLIVSTLWGPLFYLLAVIISPMCTSTQYFDRLLCGFPCYLSTNWGTFDLFLDAIIPVIIIFLANLALCLRVVYQNLNVVGRVGNNWRRQRKMAFQLGLISFVYLVVWIPLSIIQFGQIYVSPIFLLDYLDTFNFLVYVIPLVLPVIYLLSTFQLVKKLKNLLCPQQNAVVMPLNIIHTRLNNIKQPASIFGNTGF